MYVYLFMSTSIHSFPIRVISIDTVLKRYVFYDGTRIVLLPSCTFTRLPVILYGYRLYEPTIWITVIFR